MLFIPGLSSEEHLFLCVFKFMPVGEKVTRSHSVTVTLLRYFSQSSLQRLKLELGFVVFPRLPPSSGAGEGAELAQIGEKAGADVEGFGAELGSSPCLEGANNRPISKSLTKGAKSYLR